MKRIVIIVTPVIAVLVFVILIVIKSAPSKIVYKKVPQISLIKLDGSSIVLNETNYSAPLIFNFFGTDCGFCSVEINDIISFSRKQNIDVLFVSADSLNAINSYAIDLKNQGLQEGRISFAQITLADAKILFGSLVVPQTIVFESGLKIKGIKKGVVTYDYLKKAIE